MVQQNSGQDANGFQEAFALAKAALEYIGRYRTRPTPSVYEVWFRYVEGANEEVKRKLDHAIKVTGEVTPELLEGIHAQYLQSNGLVASSLDARETLATEIAFMQSTIERQREANDDFDSRVRATNEELVGEPITADRLGRCVRELLKTNSAMQQRLAQLNEQLSRTEAKLDSLERELVESQRSLVTDPLTGIGNRRFLDQMLNRAVKREAETELGAKRRIYLVLCDIDRFKKINDDLGHLAGDSYVRFVAHALSKQAGDATLARFGGDEFAILAYFDSHEEVREFIGAICEHFKANRPNCIADVETPPRITLSIGAAALRSGDTVESWFDRADKLLYAAKESGGDSGRVERDFPGQQ